MAFRLGDQVFCAAVLVAIGSWIANQIPVVDLKNHRLDETSEELLDIILCCN